MCFDKMNFGFLFWLAVCDTSLNTCLWVVKFTSCLVIWRNENFHLFVLYLETSLNFLAFEPVSQSCNFPGTRKQITYQLEQFGGRIWLKSAEHEASNYRVFHLPSTITYHIITSITIITTTVLKNWFCFCPEQEQPSWLGYAELILKNLLCIYFFWFPRMFCLNVTFLKVT